MKVSENTSACSMCVSAPNQSTECYVELFWNPLHKSLFVAQWRQKSWRQLPTFFWILSFASTCRAYVNKSVPCRPQSGTEKFGRAFLQNKQRWKAGDVGTELGCKNWILSRWFQLVNGTNLSVKVHQCRRLYKSTVKMFFASPMIVAIPM